MKRISLALVALAAALAITPSAFANTYLFTMIAPSFTSNLVLTTTGAGTTQLITDVQGTFDIAGNPSVYFPTTPTETANPGSDVGNFTLSADGLFGFDNLVYTTASGNGILDWGGFLVDIGSYELNIFSGAASGGGPGTPYFYFADNASHHFVDAIPGGSETFTQVPPNTVVTPEPSSLIFMCTGLLGLVLDSVSRGRKTAVSPDCAFIT